MDEFVYELRAANCNIDSGDFVRVSHRRRDKKTDELILSKIRDALIPNSLRYRYGIICPFTFTN